ncbi:MAG: DNA topoisomerase IV subunit A [Nitrospinota bacterium]|nr:DNA topoisomerase IV subunit A [Nitrospinota bacterium]
MPPKSKKADTAGSKSNPPRNSDLKEELESRFLSYALSTIVSRALPDVRDGLKPVHRRVIFAMNQLRLFHDGKYRKSATVVGEVMGKYHPHGDQAIYDALVRMAQSFSLRYPLVEGHGNFGSIDGDPAGAMRYTEARLAKLTGEMLGDLKKETVEFLPTFDGENKEPRLMPSGFPNLLVNGSSGIAVGIATNIPPHNMRETIDAAVAMIDTPDIDNKGLQKFIKGPDFPGGGQILTTRAELHNIYESGHGSIRLRGEWATEEDNKGKWQIVINSIPYTVNKSSLLTKIGELIAQKKMVYLVDVRDESTEDIRIVLEPKGQDVEAEKVMSYLYMHTDMQLNYHINMTALTPELRPERHSLQDVLRSYLDFRYKTVSKRMAYDLAILEERLQVLAAYLKANANLDKIIAIIRSSKTRDQAREKLMSEFKLNELQANAILDLRLAALVGLEISKIRNEKAEKETERSDIIDLLGSNAKLWKHVKKELLEIRSEYGDKRRTVVVTSTKDEPEFTAADFIEHEDTHVVVSRDGWVRRMKTLSRPETLRFKTGDSLLSWLPVSTRDLICFFTSHGKVYCVKAMDVTQTTGFGDPVQSIFRFADKERIVAVMAVIQPDAEGKVKKREQSGLFDQLDKRQVESVYGQILVKDTTLLLVTEGAMGLRFSSSVLAETNKNGRKIATIKEEDAVMGISIASKKRVFTLSADGRGLKFDLEEIPVLGGPGSGVRLMKIKDGQILKGYRLVDEKEKITLTYISGKDESIKVADLERGARGTVGRVLASKRKKLLGLVSG